MSHGCPRLMEIDYIVSKVLKIIKSYLHYSPTIIVDAWVTPLKG
jgi:hypothetical protein